MRKLLACVLFLTCASLRGQSIVTIAGGGPIGDGRLATEALLNAPHDTAIDAAGNLYISDTKNQRVRRVDAKSGIITTYAGGGSSGRGDGGPAVEAALLDPSGLALDSEGNLYIGSGVPGGIQADTVRRVSPDGIITTYTDATFVTGMAFDRDGNLHVPVGCTIRKIDRRTGSFTTVAGTGQCAFSGEGGPATAAGMNPGDVAFDRAGNLYIADTFNTRVRRVDASTGIITTVAGNGSNDQVFERGKLATETGIGVCPSIALDAEGNLFIGSKNIRVDARTGIATFAGRPDARAITRGLSFDSGGNLIGIVQRTVGKLAARSLTTDTDSPITIAGGRSIDEDGPALAVSLSLPSDVLPLPNGDLLFSETGLIRKIEAATGRVVRVAGSTAGGSISFEGLPALEATFPPPFSITRDSSGNIIFATQSNVVLKIDAATGIITRIAGRLPTAPGPFPGLFSGDGGPATQATFGRTGGLAVHPNGDLFIADGPNHRIRKVDPQSGIINTVVGSGPISPEPGSFAGDGGPATSARLNGPSDVAFDGAGNLYITDTANRRIRKVDAMSDTISTIAGGSTGVPGPAEGPALQVDLTDIRGLHSDAAGNLWFTLRPGAVRRFDAGTGRVSIVAGTGRSSFTGDSGPARTAGLNETIGVAVDARGTVFIPDRSNNRIRAVFACVNVGPPSLTAPEDGATGIATSPTLSWSSVAGAFRYDVYLDTNSPPATIVASDLTVTSFTPSNLIPETKYSWRVVAKGDPFCVPLSSNTSVIRSFTTASACDAPDAFTLTAPADGATNVASSTFLSWQAAAGAGAYDVFFGPVNPPPFFTATTSTSLALPSLIPGTTYYWNIVARAACDRTKTTSTPVRFFSVGGGCPALGPFVQIAPAPGATGVGTTATLEWSPSANASSYDLYLGDTTPPPTYLLDLTTAKLTISGLAPGRTYYWRVTAKASCDVSRTVSTPISSFIISTDCTRPQPTTFHSTVPANVVAGQTYVLSWNDASDLAPEGYYEVERSLAESFSTILDSQQTAATSASFLPAAPGTYFHRVRAVNRCNLLQPGANSATKTITVVSAPPNVIFTVQPQAAITTLGQNIEDVQSRFVIENIGTETAQVVVGRQEINSPPFFSVVDPEGGDSVNLTLEPHKPRAMEIRFSGPPNDQPATYQGIILLSSPGRALAVTPYAFVNLGIGGGPTAPPRFQVSGSDTEYVFFPGFAGDDTLRPPISVEVHNSGTTPMELGAEIGPEVWLVPEPGWNSTAIPPGASRTVRLLTRRNRAPHESALPRYTYFVVRSKNGETARLLVQDNDAVQTGAGRSSLLEPGSRSYLVPAVTSTAGAAPLMSRLRLTNVGSEPVQTELFFTPAGSDGFDGASVKRATVVVPPNDVVTLTDPLPQVFGLSPPAQGQIEVRAAPERIGFLIVSASVITPVTTGGAQTYQLATLRLGEGARVGSGHVILGLDTSGSARTSLTLAETSGTEATRVRVTVFDAQGSQRGQTSESIARYGQKTIDLAALIGGASIEGGRVELSAESGGGSVAGVVTMLAASQNSGATLVSQPAAGTVSGSALRSGRMRPSAGTQFATVVVPVVVNGALPAGTSPPGPPATFRTSMGFTTSGSPTFVVLVYRPSDPAAAAVERTVQLFPGVVVHFRNVLEQLFGVPAGASAQGSMFVQAAAGSQLYAQLLSSAGVGASGGMAGSLPIFGSLSEVITSLAQRRPLYLDGLEQSTDPVRGSRWSLLINETAGSGGSVTVRLYEAGNRSLPIVEKTMAIRGYEQIRLDTVFASLGLDTEERRKDRTNMLCVVTAAGGNAVISAVGVATDNATGDTKHYVFSPSGGVPATGVIRVSVVTPVTPPPPPPPATRRRGVRRGP